MGTVINACDFHYLIPNPVDDNVGQSGEDELAGAVDPSLATAMRKTSQAVAAVLNGLRHVGSGIGIVLLNVLNNCVEIVGGGSGPAQAH